MRLESLPDVECASQKHELGADRGFDCSQAQWRVGNVRCLQNRGLQIEDRRKADIEIARDDGTLSQFIGRFLAESCFGPSDAFHLLSPTGKTSSGIVASAALARKTCSGRALLFLQGDWNRP